MQFEHDSLVGLAGDVDFVYACFDLLVDGEAAAGDLGRLKAHD